MTEDSEVSKISLPSIINTPEEKDIVVFSVGSVYGSIKVGNSGLNIVVEKDPEKKSYRWIQHYTPGGSTRPATDSAEKIKRTLDYASALYKFFLWWKDFKETKDVNFPRENILYWSTNPTMSGLTLKLLGPDSYQEIGDDPSQKGNVLCEIHLDKLEKDELALIRLRKYYQEKNKRESQAIAIPPQAKSPEDTPQ